MPTPKRAKWYARGLKFSCHQCNNCCRGVQPGWVYVSPGQIERIARHLELDAKTFEKRFLTTDEDGDTVLVLGPGGDCVFWNDGCTIYPARPRQCRTFPFWPENLESRDAWESLKTFCHGIDQGRLYPVSEIASVLHGRATTPPTEPHYRKIDTSTGSLKSNRTG